MYILCDGNWDRPEIEISDSPRGIIEQGELWESISEDLKLPAEKIKSEFYAENLETISMKLSPIKNPERLDLIKIYLNNKNLVFEGSKSVFHKLGMSLLSYFHENSQKGEHFHLDYVEDDPLLAPTNCHVIFLCRDPHIAFLRKMRYNVTDTYS
ncbi:MULTISPECIES: hypothetical protein [unclassified Microcoleus]|uniref:hypothetical protein n=1 Tax=unclassified Microcoleus TaxID=2642155 RepID=UPI0025CFEC4A|nr:MULTISPECIES: hypothetical protein [unclassified Microcoleus]